MGQTASLPDSSTTKDIIPNRPGIRSESPKLKFVLDPLHANFTINIGTPGTQPLQSFRVIAECLAEKSEIWQQAILQAREYGVDYYWTNDDPEEIKIILNVTVLSHLYEVFSVLCDFVGARSEVLIKKTKLDVHHGEVAILTASRKLEIETMARKVLKDLEHGKLNCCVIPKTAKAERHLDIMTGSIRRGLCFSGNQEPTPESYAQHVASIEFRPVNKAHAKCVAKLA
ncbi:hypothetical protein EG327_011843 [Venturia inaequalis]|uniref:Uncharacterized protein n=1 Tax=Venturia inaequalis TaxID=5025 RepID=A0A8H3VP03_VENIN|nr:hypothetical protein EG327_011843 [Venturia inaequalis]